MDQNQVTCVSCQQVETQQLDAAGQPVKVWVCKNCGTENKVDAAAAQAVVDQAAGATPVAPAADSSMPAAPAGAEGTPPAASGPADAGQQTQ